MKSDSLSFRVFKAILALPVPVCIIIPAILLYVSNWQPGDFLPWRFLIGAACFLLGISLAVSTVRLFPKFGKGTPAPWDSTTKLIVTGPYAYVRNPMITGVVLILISEALMLASLAIGIWAVVFLIINMFYFPLSEEPGLRKRFGKEYDEYCKNVPRYLPRLTPWFRVLGTRLGAKASKKTHPVSNSEKEIYLAGGCFWGTEHFFKQIDGVLETEVGFANGHTQNPTYKEVYTDTTGYAETVHVKYNPDVVSLEFLLRMFFKAIDPTSLNKQGHDEGTRYRTGVFYTESEDLTIIEKVFAEEQQNYQQPLVVEKLPLKNFYTAEEYHQDYLDKNPDGYCHLPLSLFEFARQAKEKK